MQGDGKQANYLMLNQADHDWFLANDVVGVSKEGGVHILGIPCGTGPSVAANEFQIQDDNLAVVFDSATT